MSLRNILFGSAIGTALLGAAIAPVAFAGPGGLFKGDPAAKLERHADEIGLSDKQLESIKAITEANKPEVQDLRAEMKEARKELKALMDEASPDKSAVFDQLEDISDIKLELAKLKTETMIDIKAQLTPDQVEKIKELRAEARAERQTMKGKRGPRGGPGF